MDEKPDLDAISGALANEGYSAEQAAYRDLSILLVYCRELEAENDRLRNVVASARISGEQRFEDFEARISRLERLWREDKGLAVRTEAIGKDWLPNIILVPGPIIRGKGKVDVDCKDGGGI